MDIGSLRIIIRKMSKGVVVGLYVKESLPSKDRIDLVTLPECRAYFSIQKSVGWTFDTLELPTAQTLICMAA